MQPLISMYRVTRGVCGRKALLCTCSYDRTRSQLSRGSWNRKHLSCSGLPDSPLLKTPGGYTVASEVGTEVGQGPMYSQASGQWVIFLPFLDPVSLPGYRPHGFPSPLAPSASCLGSCLPSPASEWHLSHTLPSSPDLDTGTESVEVLTKSVYFWQRRTWQGGGGSLLCPLPSQAAVLMVVHSVTIKWSLGAPGPLVHTAVRHVRLVSTDVQDQIWS